MICDRARPRDWYDVWYLLTNEEIEASRIQKLFDAECAFKNVPFNGIEDYFNPELMKKIANAWERSLERQLKDVPPFAIVQAQLRPLLEALHATSL